MCVRWLYFIWQQSICMIVFYILDFIKLFTWNDKMNEEERKWVSERTSKYLSSTFICLLHTLWKSVPYTYTFRKMPKTPPHIVSASSKYSHFFLLFLCFGRVLLIRRSKRMHLLFEFLTPKNKARFLLFVYFYWRCSHVEALCE